MLNFFLIKFFSKLLKKRNVDIPNDEDSDGGNIQDFNSMSQNTVSHFKNILIESKFKYLFINLTIKKGHYSRHDSTSNVR